MLYRSLGTKEAPSPKKARKGKRPRITDEKLARMKALYAKKVSPERIAKQLHVSPQSVHNWVAKKFKR